jgi:anti-sigma factor RsiW
MSEPPLDDRELLLQAAVDDELDAAGMLAFERAMQEDAELAGEYQRLVALRGALRRVAKPRASAALRARIEALPGSGPAPRALPQASLQQWGRGLTGQWRPAAVAAAIAFLAGGGVSYLALQQAEPAATQLLVASHVRGLISGQATDVPSSDRHTVKPWFATKSAVSPPVVDLAGDGFPLVGGRLDVIGVTPVPTLVYRHGEHVISLTEVPERVAGLEPGRRSDAGYVVLTWRQGAAAYVAISDAQAAEVEAFAAAYRKATAAAP